MHKETPSNIHKSLAEQMHIDERELTKRKALLNFTSDDVKVLIQYKPYISSRIDDLVRHFYEKQIQVPEISLLIGDSETLSRLKGAMRRYILELFDGYYDSEYVNRRLRIGKVHNRIGVSPKLYISAIWLLQSVITEEIDRDRDPTRDVQVLKEALNKLIMLDTQFVFDTYIASMVNEVESARAELQNYASSLENQVAQRTAQIEEMSRKDFLTGVYNKRAFIEHLQRELNSAERHGEQLSLIYFDLNGFKLLNDKEGHLAGDVVLSETGRCMLTVLRGSDIACRYGGDEFCAILPRTNKEGAIDIVNRMVESFSDMDNKGISFSVGIKTVGPEYYPDYEEMVTQADQLMYRSKEKARESADFHITAIDETDHDGPGIEGGLAAIPIK